MNKSALLLSALTALVACSTNALSSSPVQPEDDAEPDAPSTGILNTTPDANTSACNYTEAHDGSNDNNVDPDAIEPTSLSFPGTETLCGVVNNGHYSSEYDTVDVDNYEITVGSGSGTSNLGVIFTVPGEMILAAGGEIAVTLRDDFGSDIQTGGFVVGDIAAFHTFAPILVGNYQLNVDAFGTGSDIPAPLPYVITIVGDL